MRVLICGGSIAGMSAAYWLARSGHQVTLVEHAPEVRMGGVAVDVRGDALDVVEEMGLLRAVRERAVVGQDVFRFVDAAGLPQAELRVADDFYDSPQDIEISRDVLCQLLYDALPAEVEKVFGQSVVAVDDTAGSVVVGLSDGSERHVELLVGADGMHSAVRALTFGPEAQFVRHLGLYVGIVKCCTAAAEIQGSEVFNSPGRMLMLRSDGRAASALIGYRSPWIDYDFRDVDAQKQMVMDAFDGEDAWRVPQVVAEVADCPDFYFDSVSQIKMPSWTSGRTALVGDSGYCASFFSGMGTSLALVGARTLAMAVGDGSDLDAGLAEYTLRMRPVVDAAHQVADEGARLLFPLSETDIAERNHRVRAGLSAL